MHVFYVHVENAVSLRVVCVQEDTLFSLIGRAAGNYNIAFYTGATWLPNNAAPPHGYSQLSSVLIAGNMTIRMPLIKRWKEWFRTGWELFSFLYTDAISNKVWGFLLNRLKSPSQPGNVFTRTSLCLAWVLIMSAIYEDQLGKSFKEKIWYINCEISVWYLENCWNRRFFLCI